MAAKKSSKKAVKKSTAKKAEKSTAQPSQSGAQAATPQQAQPQIIEPDNISYHDGLAGLSLYQGVAKMDFYKVVGMNPDGTEIRKLSDRVVIPANKLVEVEQAIQQIAAAIQNAQQDMQMKG